MWSPAALVHDDVLPPNTSRLSNTSTSTPASSSLTAVARPASPPPTMMALGMALVLAQLEQPDRLIAHAGREALAIRTHRQREDAEGAWRELRRLLAGLRVPEDNIAVRAARGDHAPIGRECHAREQSLL